MTGWTFLAPACPRATGGDIARFELVNALARTGVDRVRVVHLPTHEMAMRDLTDLPWFAFDPAVEHLFAASLDPDAIPDDDVVVYSTKLLSTALAQDDPPTGRRLVDALQGREQRRWAPIALLQGHGLFRPAIEDLAFRLPGPKVCVGSWLADLLVRHGVPRSSVVHIPNGLDPQRFHVIRAIDRRAPSVAMNFDPYPMKRGRQGLRALNRLHRRHGVPSAVFGTLPLDQDLPPGVTFRHAPSQSELAAIYNDASMFLQPSQQEGFGMCAVESMACGSALVTTSNGGSDDYAIDDETAVICGPEPEEMASALAGLVDDDNRRQRIARAGARHVERFRWPTSAERLRSVAEAWRTDPDRGDAAPVDLDEVVDALAQ